MHTIRMKIRDFEVEGIGFDSLEKFEPILNRALEIWKDNTTPRQPLKTQTFSPATGEQTAQSDNIPEITMNTFVARVGADSCRDLLKASAGYLAIVTSQERIRHEDLIATAKGCSRWKKTYSNMMSKDLKRMIEKNEIIENASGQYSLPPVIMEEMRSKLTNG